MRRISGHKAPHAGKSHRAHNAHGRRHAPKPIPEPPSSGPNVLDNYPAGHFNSTPTPRPLGVASGFPWQPRSPEREQAKSNFIVRAVEFFEEHPGVPNLGAVLVGLWGKLFVHDSAQPGPPVVDEPDAWMFAAVGDYGVASRHQSNVAANIMRANPNFVLTVGDNVYPTGRWEDYAKNFDPEHYMGGVARRFPFMPSLGNHDLYHDDLRPYFGHFPHLKGYPYYTYTYRNAQFYSIDSDQDLRPGSAQYTWLENALKTSAQQWKIVYLHYPLYSGHSLGELSELRNSLDKMLRENGVQLIITGHEHNYDRTIPVNGIVEIITGGGGQQSFGFANKQPDNIAYRKSAYHHVEVSVSSKSLIVRAIDEHGKLFDTSVIPYAPVAQAQAGVAKVRKKKASAH